MKPKERKLDSAKLAKFTVHDPVEYLDSEEAIAEYLKTTREHNNSALLRSALENVAKALERFNLP